MIRMTGQTRGGEPALLLAVTAANVEHLKSGRVLTIQAAEMRQMGLPACQVSIFYGETARDIAAMLREQGCDVPDVPEDFK